MYCDGYWVSCCSDSGIERENPQTGKTELCEGYFCQVYEDGDYQNDVDSFCLAVGYEIPDLSDASLERGIREYLSPAFLTEKGHTEHRTEQRSRFEIRPASNDEAGIFYAQEPEQDKQMGAIGHVRIDFGQDGDEFWHTWHPRGEENLNSAEFKEELGRVVNQLRESVLKDLPSMTRFCHEHDGRINGGWRQNYGYVVETENYRYCLRCSPGRGDYHAYLTCFDLNVQRANLAKEHATLSTTADNRKKGILEQLSGHRELAQEQDPLKSKRNHTGRKEPSL